MQKDRKISLAIILLTAFLFNTEFLCKNAAAGQIHGRVYRQLESGPSLIKSNAIYFCRQGSKIMVRVDEKGQYHVFLSPGSYTVMFQSNGTVYSAKVYSYHGASQKDIFLTSNAQNQ